MASHPINLALRFLLELAALFSMGFWGWKQSDNILKFILAIGLPLTAAIIWGTFAVPNDPSRSGSAPVPTPGIIRLLIEFAIFAFATLAFFDVGYNRLSMIFLIVVVVHYVFSYDRIQWLVNQ